ncbi:MAG: hypothetical protein ACLPKE_31190 [Streptosporangiaceae bacterium]
MNLTSRAGRRLAAAIALACSAILLPAAAQASPAAQGTPGHPASPVLALAGSATGAAAHPQQRQLAVTTLSNFKVVLTATRSPGTTPGPMATVTAAGYRPTARGWKLIATKRIGAAGSWSWYATEVCSLAVTQTKPGPPSGSPAAVPWDSMTVSLLWGPALGCLPPSTAHWGP